MFTLFYAPGACSLASHIALEEIGAPYEAHKLDLAAGDQAKAAYLAVNPRARVPALVTPGGALTESPAILRYLADLYPERALLPADPLARAQAQSLMNWFSAHLHIAFAHIFRPARFTDDQSAAPAMKAKALETIAAAFGEMDARLGGKDWLFDDYSVVDPYLTVFCLWAGRVGLDMSACRNVLAHADRVAQRPAVQRVFAREGIRIDG